MKKLNIKGDATRVSLSTTSSHTTISTVMINDLEIIDIDKNEQSNVPVAYSTKHIPVSMNAIAQNEDVQNWPHLRDIPMMYVCLLYTSPSPRD